MYMTGLELSESNEVGVKYGFILGLKKFLLLKSISQSNTNQKKQTNNKESRKKSKTKPILGLTLT